MSERTYYMDDCVIAVPGGPRDRSVNVLEWDLEGGDKIALVIQREPLPALVPGQPVTLQVYVGVQTRELPAQLAGFHLEREEATSADSPFEISRWAFRWQREQEVLYHHQAFVRIGDGVIVFSGSGKARHREAIDRLLDTVLADLRVRAD